MFPPKPDGLGFHNAFSMNSTYINDQRLYPHEVRVLNDGDELRLGHLIMRVQILNV